MGKGLAGEGSHCGQGTETCLEEALVGDPAFGRWWIKRGQPMNPRGAAAASQSSLGGKGPLKVNLNPQEGGHREMGADVG